MTQYNRYTRWRASAVVAGIFLMAAMAAFNEVKTGGLACHEALFLSKTSGTPLSESVALAGGRCLAAWGVLRPLGSSLVLFQVALNTALGLVLLGYWRRLGVSWYWGLLGFSAVAWALTQVVFPEGLPIAITADLLLLVAGARAVASKRPLWIIPCAILLWMNQSPHAVLLAALLGISPWKHGSGRAGILLSGILIYAGGLFLLYPAATAWNILGGVWGIAPWLAVAAVNPRTPGFPLSAGGMLLAWGLSYVFPHAPRADTLYALMPLLLVFLPVLLEALSSDECRAWSESQIFIVACAAFLSAYAVYHQISIMDAQGGLAWYEKVQWERTCQVMRGEQGTPWQYRLFTDSIVYGTVRAFEAMGVPRPIGTAFVLIRLLQNTLMGCLAVAFYRRMGIPALAGLLGVGLLTCGMGHGLYDTDMTFNTYTDMSLFLIAAILICDGKFLWIVPLMLIAPFNRETSGCIPFMFLFSQWRFGERPAVSRNTWAIFAGCLLLWIAIVGGLRLVYGMRPYIVPTAGKSPILPLLWFNLTWWRTWVFLLATLGIIPFLALAAWRTWPERLRRFFWAVVPIWFPAHFCLAHAPETRLFLVPQALIFLPGALLVCSLNRAGRNQ